MSSESPPSSDSSPASVAGVAPPDNSCSSNLDAVPMPLPVPLSTPQPTDLSDDEADSEEVEGDGVRARLRRRRDLPPPPSAAGAQSSSVSAAAAGASSRLHSLRAAYSSSASLLSSSTPTLLPLCALPRLARGCWKLLQTLMCVVSCLLCGGFFCGCCCVPCRRRKRRGQHRRRRRRSSASAPTGDPASVASSASAAASSLSTIDEAPFQSWSEEDDSEFEYESKPAARAACMGPCRLLLLLFGVLFVYSLLFVRVVPSARNGGSGVGGTNAVSGLRNGFEQGEQELEVRLGLGDLIAPIGVPIPNQLHSSIQAIIGQATTPGKKARQDGVRAHFPVVFIPGVVSTGLEVWEGEACAKGHFRQRLWGSTLMLRSILLDSRCWLRHLSLDGWTGLDPPGIKLRPASGLEAADYLVGNFWVWAKLIENFSEIGYDSNSMLMSPYDWRLSFKHLQQRDYFFTKLKLLIEVAKLSNHDRKVVLIAHSMGSSLVHYFLQWVESPRGGGGGPHWVDRHVESWVNIGPTWLGVPKVYSAMLSGEMRDTAELAPFLDYWRQRVVLSQSDVLRLMRTIRSLPSMWPKGGSVVWGDEHSAPDDEMEGEDADPTRTPTRDYPGGRNESFTPTQASAASATSEEDSQRVRQAVKRERKQKQGNGTDSKEGDDSAGGDSKKNDASSSKDSSSQSTAPRTTLGQFLTFSQPIPWPFLNITAEVDAFDRERAAAKAHGSEPRSAEEFMQQLRNRALLDADTAAALANSSSDFPTARARALTDLNLDDATHLFKLVAWSDAAFNDELYSQGFGQKSDWPPHSNSSLPPPRPSADRSGRPLDMLPLDSDDQRHWANPLESSLPHAPRMKLYCLYGVGRDTERGYVYAKASAVSGLPRLADLLQSRETQHERMRGSRRRTRHGRGWRKRREDGAEEGEHGDGGERREPYIGARSPTVPLFALNTSFHLPSARIRSGVKLTDGDGTVPLLSLGYMCVDGWRQRRWNPSGMAVVTREYRDLSDSPPLLRAATSVDHVDIMGNHDMITDLLYIAGIRVPQQQQQQQEEGEDRNTDEKDDTLDLDASDDEKRGAQSSDSSAAGSKEQHDWSEAEDSTRFRGEASSGDGEHQQSEEAADKEEAEGELEKGDSSSSSQSSRRHSRPLGELTWPEVGERIYSRIRAISARVHARWESHTGHKLEPADPPPPLNPNVRRMPFRPLTPTGEADSDTDDFDDDSTPPSVSSGEWSDEDERLLRRLLQRKQAAASVASDAAKPGASGESESLEERLEREAAAKTQADQPSPPIAH